MQIIPFLFQVPWCNWLKPSLITQKPLTTIIGEAPYKSCNFNDKLLIKKTVLARNSLKTSKFKLELFRNAEEK